TGGGDSEISLGRIDPATGCSTIAFSGLHNIDVLDNFTVTQSLDCGRSFGLANVYATQNTLDDRQWQTFDGVKTNHLTYHKVDTVQFSVTTSYAGGQPLLPAPPDAAHGIVDANHAYTLPQIQIGNLLTDDSRPVAGRTYPVSGEPVHALFAIFEGTRDL